MAGRARMRRWSSCPPTIAAKWRPSQQPDRLPVADGDGSRSLPGTVVSTTPSPTGESAAAATRRIRRARARGQRDRFEASTTRCHGRPHTPAPPFSIISTPGRSNGPRRDTTASVVFREPRRVSRRLPTLRDWAHETFKQILPGASGTGSAVGPGPPGRARNAMGGDRLGVVEGGLFGRDASQVGASGGTRPRPATGAHERGA